MHRNRVKFYRPTLKCELQYLVPASAFKWNGQLFVRADLCGEKNDKVFCICLSSPGDIRVISRFAHVIPCDLEIVATEKDANL